MCLDEEVLSNWNCELLLRTARRCWRQKMNDAILVLLRRIYVELVENESVMLSGSWIRTWLIVLFRVGYAFSKSTLRHVPSTCFPSISTYADAPDHPLFKWNIHELEYIWTGWKCDGMELNWFLQMCSQSLNVQLCLRVEGQYFKTERHKTVLRKIPWCNVVYCILSLYSFFWQSRAR